MPGNIQFMEPVNLLSQDKGGMSEFWDQPYVIEVRAAVFLGLYSFVGH